MRIIDRLDKYMLLKDLNDNQITVNCGLSVGLLGKARKEGNDIGKKAIEKMLSFYQDLNNVWLLTGEGEMLKESENNLLQSENIKYKLVPLYNLDAVGGIENDAVDIKPYISEYIPFRDARDTDICIPVSGKSMMPTYSPGTIILIRQLFDWQSYTELGQIYVLVLKDGRRLLKEIKRSEENTRDNFLLYSHNPEFQPTEIPKSIITDIYLVIALYQKTTM